MGNNPVKLRAPLFLLPLVAALTLALLPDTSLATGAATIDKEPQDCRDYQPAATAGPLGEREELTLEVLILLDGISVPRGREIVAQAQSAYDPLGVRLVPTFREVSVEPDTIDDTVFGQGEPAHSGNGLFTAAKELVHGARPWNIDVVYLMTATEIRGAGAGIADCIGGVRSGTRSFAIGEADEDPHEERNWPSRAQSAKILAHEIGHLLGAHHHYANCAQGDASTDITPCTMMFNDAGLVSLRFSTIEATVVRGYVERYAANTPTGPEPEIARTLTFKMRKGPVARGYLDSPHNRCSIYVPVEIQKEIDGTWETIASTKTIDNGTYRVDLDGEEGIFRSVVPKMYLIEDDERVACARIESRTRELDAG